MAAANKILIPSGKKLKGRRGPTSEAPPLFREYTLGKKPADKEKHNHARMQVLAQCDKIRKGMNANRPLFGRALSKSNKRRRDEVFAAMKERDFTLQRGQTLDWDQDWKKYNMKDDDSVSAEEGRANAWSFVEAKILLVRQERRDEKTLKKARERKGKRRGKKVLADSSEEEEEEIAEKSGDQNKAADEGDEDEDSAAVDYVKTKNDDDEDDDNLVQSSEGEEPAMMLILPSKKKKSTPVITPSNAFGFGDEDEEGVEEYDEKPASLNPYVAQYQKSILLEREVDKQLSVNPTMHQYDEVYDAMKKSAKKTSRQKKDTKKAPKYIAKLLEKAKEREIEDTIYYQRKTAQEEQAEADAFGGKEKFVTSAYKEKLEAAEKWKLEQKRKEEEEKKDDVRKKGDLSGFYSNLISRNVAMGAGEENSDEENDGVARRKQETQESAVLAESDALKDVQLVDASQAKQEEREEEHEGELKQEESLTYVADDVVMTELGRKNIRGYDEMTPEQRAEAMRGFKRSDNVSVVEKRKRQIEKKSKHDTNAVLSAKERYLQRKKAKLEAAAQGNSS